MDPRLRITEIALAVRDELPPAFAATFRKLLAYRRPSSGRTVSLPGHPATRAKILGVSAGSRGKFRICQVVV
jgi:hypothetical protein